MPRVRLDSAIDNQPGTALRTVMGFLRAFRKGEILQSAPSPSLGQPTSSTFAGTAAYPTTWGVIGYKFCRG
ncbi:MAG: hypothetical protein ACREQC_05270 [Candidatus Binataceae bacterium]